MDRFPHSEIRGSSHICWSPRLIAAYHVLLRLWEPRHSPCTLSYFLLRITPFARNGMSLFESLVLSSESWVLYLTTLNFRLQTSDLSPICCLLFFSITSSNMSKNVSKSWVLSLESWVFSDFRLHTSDFRLKAWRITDSNRWPSACKADALASWANPPIRLMCELVI